MARIRRASEFSMMLEKLSLSTRTSAGLVMTLALRMFLATSPNGDSPSACGHAGAAHANGMTAEAKTKTNWERSFTGLSLYFA